MSDPFVFCHGVVPLRPRVAPWIETLLAEQRVEELVARHGSPVNIQSTAPFVAHMNALVAVGAARGLEITPFFARKANKCLSYVEAARDQGHGIDAASHAEVAQALEAGLPGARIICTAGVKPDALISLCVDNDVTLIVDNDDERAVIVEQARERGGPARIGLRVAGFVSGDSRLHSRFGYPIEGLDDTIAALEAEPALDLAGLQFHLGGYDPAQRAAALVGLLPHARALADRRRERGEPAPFIDMGGGLPMRYLADPEQWPAYLAAHARALDGEDEPITYNNDALGRRPGEAGWSAPDAYPTAHPLVQADWLAAVLDTEHAGRPIHQHLLESGVTLRCEPGRSVLDDCGVTLARVVHVKQDTRGRYVIGVEMNRTQFRTGFAEVMFDGGLIPREDRDARGPIEGYLTGTYCTESEFIFKRRFVFPEGVARGDIVVLPNSAGYLIHFLESRSHQFPLAANLFVDHHGALVPDALES